MKIKNETHWNTKQLKAIIMRVAQDELDDMAKRKRLRIVIVYSRNYKEGYSSGCATVGGAWMKIRVPSGYIDKVCLAHTIAHELAHVRGMQHREMNSLPKYGYKEGWRDHHAYAEQFPLEKNVKVKLVRVTQDKRYQLILDRKKAWTTKLKRAQTALRKLTQKERYYQRALAAKSPKDES